MGQFDASLGPLVIATSLNAALFGICVVQFYNYATSRFRDHGLVRGIVAMLAIVDSVYTASTVYSLWDFTVVHFTDVSYLQEEPWPFTYTPLMTSLASISVQHYLAHRIHHQTNNWIYLYIISFLSVSQALCGIGSSIAAFYMSGSPKLSKLKPVLDAWMGLGIACNSLIALLLTSSIINSVTSGRRPTRTTRIMVETTVLVLIFTIAEILTFFLLPKTNIQLVFAFPMGRLYTITLLLTLNSRIRESPSQSDDTVDNMTTLPSVSYGKFRGGPAVSRRNPRAEPSYGQTIHHKPSFSKYPPLNTDLPMLPPHALNHPSQNLTPIESDPGSASIRFIKSDMIEDGANANTNTPDMDIEMGGMKRKLSAKMKGIMARREQRPDMEGLAQVRVDVDVHVDVGEESTTDSGHR